MFHTTYDASGNITSDGGQTFSYDATGQEVTASIYNSQFSYDGDRLRGKKVEDGPGDHLLSAVECDSGFLCLIAAYKVLDQRI